MTRRIFKKLMVIICLASLTACSATNYNASTTGPGDYRLISDVNMGAPFNYYPPFNYDALDEEEYDRIEENPFLDALSNPLSTFSVDVDTASYSIVRRIIQQGNLPPVDAVRLEELINYFNYNYKEPAGPHPFSVTTEVSSCPWNKRNRLVMIGIKGKRVAMDNLPPANFVFLIDVSGSMTSRLPLVKSSLKLLVNQLKTEDQLSIVVYAGAAGLVLPPTGGDNKVRIIRAIEGLQAGGSTAGGEGLELAYKIANQTKSGLRNNRIIMVTDGDFNVGPASQSELYELIEEKRDQGIFLTVLGFGMGNYKDSYMELLADKGDGNYAYIDSLLEAKKVLNNELSGTLYTIAKDVKIQTEFNPAKIGAYRLLGYENRLMRKEDFNNDTKDAGEIGAGHVVTALYEVTPVNAKMDMSNDGLKYTGTVIKANATQTAEMMTVKLRYKDPEESGSKLISHIVVDNNMDINYASEDFRFASAVAEFALLLRNSKYKGSASFDAVIERAELAKGVDAEGYRNEFVQMASIAKSLGQ